MLQLFKHGTLTDPHEVMVLFTPQYQESQPFLDCIANFAKIMLRHQKNRNHQQPTNVYGDIVHGEILVIFKKAKKELQEVEPLSQS
jgi:hypothetical protein